MADGLLLRVRVPGGRLDARQARALAAVAARAGNGTLDITRRANIQLRGLGEATMAGAVAALEAAGLAPPSPAADRARNLVASPFGSPHLDLPTLVAALDAAVEANAARWPGLPVKASVVLDGGAGDAIGTDHDLGFAALEGGRLAVSLANTAVGRSVAPADAPALLVAAFDRMATGGARLAPQDRLADRSHPWPDWAAFVPSEPVTAPLPPSSPLPLGRFGTRAIVLAPRLNRCTADTLSALAALSETGDGLLRLAPGGRIALDGLADPDRATTDAFALGFATHEDVRVIACAGATGCERTAADTKGDAARLLAALQARPEAERRRWAGRTVHLSGCARGCASSAPADLLALGQTGAPGYALHRDARADTTAVPEAHTAPHGLGDALIARLRRRMEAA